MNKKDKFLNEVNLDTVKDEEILNMSDSDNDLSVYNQVLSRVSL